MEKLFKLINEIGKISKDKTNPFYKSSYFDINTLMEHLKPLLEKYKLLLIQPLSNVDGRPAIHTAIVDIENNKTVLTETVTLPDLQDPQKMGSCITYYRRYALQSALCLEAEDDDGNKGASKVKTPVKPIDPNIKKKNDIKELVKELSPDIKDTEMKDFIETTTKQKIEDKNLDDIITILGNLLQEKEEVETFNKISK